MSDKFPINNIIVFDGNKEYNINQIYQDNKIYSLVNRAFLAHNLDDEDFLKINTNNWQAHIRTNPDFALGSLYIKGADKEFYKKHKRLFPLVDMF